MRVKTIMCTYLIVLIVVMCNLIGLAQLVEREVPIPVNNKLGLME